MARLIIKEIAELAGVSFSELTKLTSISSTLLERYWNNKIENVSLDTLQKIANVMGVASGDLIQDGLRLNLSEEEKEQAFLAQQDLIVRANLRRARIVGSTATLTLDEWLCTLEHFKRKCAYCYGEYNVLEHVTSLSKSGGTTSTNCAPACWRCNTWKDRATGDILSPEEIKRVQNELIALFSN